MKTVILAGGLGTRISEESHLKPKPMIEIGGKPILWHIMKLLSAQGLNEFIICAGYKQYMIKEYFANYFLHNSDITFDFSNSQSEITIHDSVIEPWKVTIIDTGLNTMTGGRVKRIARYLDEDESFLLTYGDGVADINISELINCHKQSGALATISAHNASQRFGVLDVSEDGMVNDFREKTAGDGALINIGFMVLEPAFLSYIEGDATVLEKDTLRRLASENKLNAYKHRGYWQCMDNMREKQQLEQLWTAGNAPWKIWE